MPKGIEQQLGEQKYSLEYKIPFEEKGIQRVALIGVTWLEQERRVKISSLEVDKFVEEDWKDFRDAINKSGKFVGLNLIKVEKGKFELDNFALSEDRRLGSVTGEIIRKKEFGVADIRLEAARSDEAEIIVWYKGKEEKGFSFWGVEVKMPFSKKLALIPPTVMIRPTFDPEKIIYWAPSLTSLKAAGYIFTDGWELKMQTRNVVLEEGKKEFSVKHRVGIKEKVMVGWQCQGNWLNLDLEREVISSSLPVEVVSNPDRLSLFDPTSLKVAIPIPFPPELVEFGNKDLNEADFLIRKFKDFDSFLRKTLGD